MSYAASIGGIDVGDLTKNLFNFVNASEDLNLQGATKGYKGDIAVVAQDATNSALRTSGSVPYSGLIRTDANTLGDWQDIVNDNSAGGSLPLNAATALLNDSTVTALTGQLVTAIQQGLALTASAGFEDFDWGADGNIDTQNGVDDITVVNVTEFSASTMNKLIGDKDYVFILRSDEDLLEAGLQGQVKFQSGGGIDVGGVTKISNILNFAGDTNASGGGSNPPGVEARGRLDELAASSPETGSPRANPTLNSFLMERPRPGSWWATTRTSATVYV